MKIFIFCLTVLMSMTVHAAKSDCKEPSNTNEMRECSLLNLDKATKELGVLEKKLATTLVNYFDNELSPNFLEIQSQWRSFIEVQCAHKRKLYGRGSFSSISYITCLEKYTDQRINNLRNIYSVVLDN